MKENEKHLIYHPTEPPGINTISNDGKDDGKAEEEESKDSYSGNAINIPLNMPKAETVKLLN
mgnify:CR=1 FL=1